MNELTKSRSFGEIEDWLSFEEMREFFLEKENEA